MRSTLYIIISLIAVGYFAVSCSKDMETCDESLYCDTLPYDSGWVDIEIDYKNQGVPIKLYRGLIEDGNLISEDTAYDNVYYYYLPLGNRYSAEAYYENGNQTIITLNSVKLSQSSFYNCGEECYEEAEVDLDLKKL